MNIIIVSGGFDPIHSGHIAYLKAAKEEGDRLIVALNSDDWLVMKKGKFFMPFSERKIILENISYVDEVIDFKDDKKGTAIQALQKVKESFPKDKIFFANGGDRNINNRIISGTFIDQNSEQYTHEKIILKNTKEIIETSKDSKGQPDTYKMTIMLDVLIENKQNNIREIVITEDFSYKNLENKFDLSEYEINVQNDLLKKISDELIIYLSL